MEKLFCLCIPIDLELSNRHSLSLHSILFSPSILPYKFLGYFIILFHILIKKFSTNLSWTMSDVVLHICAPHAPAATLLLINMVRFWLDVPPQLIETVMWKKTGIYRPEIKVWKLPAPSSSNQNSNFRKSCVKLQNISKKSQCLQNSTIYEILPKFSNQA